jgi:hypothetical protein
LPGTGACSARPKVEDIEEHIIEKGSVVDVVEQLHKVVIDFVCQTSIVVKQAT